VGTASPPPPHAAVRRRGVGPHAVSSNASMTLVSAAVTDADSSHTAPSIIPSGFSCRLQRRRSLPAMLRSMEAPLEGGALHASVTEWGTGSTPAPPHPETRTQLYLHHRACLSARFCTAGPDVKLPPRAVSPPYDLASRSGRPVCISAFSALAAGPTLTDSSIFTRDFVVQISRASQLGRQNSSLPKYISI
jgi:hypothetical protein